MDEEEEKEQAEEEQQEVKEQEVQEEEEQKEDDDDEQEEKERQEEVQEENFSHLAERILQDIRAAVKLQHCITDRPKANALHPSDGQNFHRQFLN